MGAAGHAQFLIATHSPILLACPQAEIFSFDTIPLQTITYKQTPTYQLYADFLANPAAYLSAPISTHQQISEEHA
jgi:predicted ATPase